MFHRGDVIRKHREHAGWTQLELGRRAGLNKATIAKVEAHDPAVTLDTVVKVVKALGLSLEDLEPGVTSPVTTVAHTGAHPTALSVRVQEALNVADTAKTRLQLLVASLDEQEAALALKEFREWLGPRWATRPTPKK